MLDTLIQNKQNVLVVGDVFVSCETMADAVRQSSIPVGQMHTVFWGEHSVESFSQKQVNIEKNGPDAEPYPAEIDACIQDVHVLMTHFAPIPGHLIEKAKNLRCILTCRGGLEHIDVQAASARNIPVINVIRNAEPVADFTLGLILALTRNIATAHTKLIAGEWSKSYPNYEYTTTLSNLTIGLAGLGNVGLEIAKRLKALGVKTLGFDEYVTQERLEKNGLGDLVRVDRLEDLFKTADVISLHLRLTEETRGMIDRRYFSLMKPSSYFINTSRGGLVKQADLIETLRAHRIAGAALDVFEKEPVTRETGFVGLDNIIVTPHIAGDTVSAVPKSPYLLMREFDSMCRTDNPERMVNFKNIRLS